MRKSGFLITVGLASVVLCSQLHAELYRWTDEQGRVHFSDKKNSDKAATYKPKSALSTYSTPEGVQVKQQKENYSDLPPYEKRRATPDIDRLYAVPYPKSPTKFSVAAYIQKIYAISRNQKQHLRGDPQVSLLSQVGTEHLDVLIKETYSHVGWHNYGIEAIKKLATERHKKQIFAALKAYSKYAEVIYHKGWHFEIQDRLISGLRNNRGYVPHQWIKAVAEFNRADAREVLIEYFKYGWNNHSTYRIISGLPGIQPQLNQAIPIAWETARSGNKHAMSELTSRALELGYMPAFKFVMLSLLDNANMQKHWFNAHELATRYTNQTGSAREILNWYKSNQGQIRFDAEKTLFFVKKS